MDICKHGKPGIAIDAGRFIFGEDCQPCIEDASGLFKQIVEDNPQNVWESGLNEFFWEDEQ